MYVTRPLSFSKKSRSALFSLPPPEGPHSGYLLIQGQDVQDYNWCSCFGMHRGTRYKSLPLPQDRVLSVNHFEDSGDDEIVVHTDETIFIPVPGQPLSSNLYYIISADGEDMGLLCTCSSENICSCQCRCIKDVRPQRLNSRNLYQRMKVTNRSGRFVIGSAASDGIPPQFLRRAGWTMYKSDFPLPCPKIAEVKGLDAALRTKLPKLNFDISKKLSETVVVGEWYCPFIFIREFGGLDHPKAQMEQSFLLYRMSLEQQWEEIFSEEAFTNEDQSESVAVGTVVAREEALIGGEAEVHEEWKVEDGMMLLKAKNVREGLVGIGLSVEIVQKMVMDQKKGPGDAVDVRVDRVFKSRKKPWKRFGCYVLVERYTLRRMNGGVVLTYSFRHTNHIQLSGSNSICGLNFIYTNQN